MELNENLLIVTDAWRHSRETFNSPSLGYLSLPKIVNFVFFLVAIQILTRRKATQKVVINYEINISGD